MSTGFCGFREIRIAEATGKLHCISYSSKSAVRYEKCHRMQMHPERKTIFDEIIKIITNSPETAVCQVFLKWV
jgi:hypothetical protein